MGNLTTADAGAGPGQEATQGKASTTSLAETRTSLALDRTNLALERTLEAWIRTTLSMISFGFTLGKLVQSKQDQQVAGIFGERTWSITSLAYFLVVVGVAALVAATVQHRIRVHALYKRGLPRQFSVAVAVAIVVSVVGAFAFTALVLDL
ncbi:MAG: DUF202 domain-containing protein [Pseudoxanthomonas sp.]